MNTRAAMIGGVAAMLAITGAATWATLGAGHHAPAVGEVADIRLPVPPMPPRIASGAEYERCLALLSTDPAGAAAMAEAWQARHGGEGATHCLGLSRVAGGEPAVGGAILQALAEASHAPPAARAILFGQAAQAWMMAGQPDRATQAATSALALSPQDPELLMDRATAGMALGRFRAAAADLSEALATDPRRADALVMRGTALRHLGRLDAARDDIARALAAEPDNPEALLERGILRQRGHDAAGARADWQRIIALTPDSPTADLAEQNLALLEAGPVR
ncbi:MAG: hypothetical protein BGP12_03835 [Rhodospirillales bacterium 70-18]|nr:tetratricopeptide repeat protein [Rhodospirillales bacterium]OJY64877.1 MAG: hypothetical protein BGP12_03835 [Rhodospirillales bacterium 70-18]